MWPAIMENTGSQLMMFIRMGYRGTVSQEQIERVQQIIADPLVDERRRAESHGGWWRELEHGGWNIDGPLGTPLPCPRYLTEQD